MLSTEAPSRKLRSFWAPLRVLLVRFLVALLSFAVWLLLAILGLTVSAWLRGAHPDMTVAYRHIAFPAAAVLGAIALAAAIGLEVRQCRKDTPHSNVGVGVPPLREREHSREHQRYQRSKK